MRGESMSDIRVSVQQGDSPIRVLPGWLSVMPEEWVIECFEISMDHTISPKWGTA